LICFAFTIVVSLISFFLPKLYLLIFLQNSAVEAINIGIAGSKILALPYFFMILLIMFDSLYNGVGDNFTAMIITIVSIWGIRIPLISYVSEIYGVNGLWVALGLSYILSGILSFGYYKTGRWKTKGIVK
jgi:Na+-driven multidrug efflux pump